jgi:hypothetical protein
MTVSAAADQMIAYFNGVIEAAPRTGLGTWAGTLASISTLIGAETTVPASPWSGSLAVAALWNTALTAAQIARLTDIGSSYLALDIGSRIDLTETQTATTGKKFVVRGLDYELDAGGTIASMALHVKALSDSTYWILNDPVHSVLGSTTRLGL